MAPTPDELEDLVLSARFGDLEDVQAFADAHGWEAAAAARDDRGNSALHMACGNGHVGESERPQAACERAGGRASGREMVCVDVEWERAFTWPGDGAPMPLCTGARWRAGRPLDPGVYHGEGWRGSGTQ
jgi:hypothetical protein